MNAGLLLQLHENLRSLTLGNAARHLEERLRQAEERGASYEEFLLDLTDGQRQLHFPVDDNYTSPNRNAPEL